MEMSPELTGRIEDVADEPTETRYFHVAGTGHPLPLGVGWNGGMIGRVEVRAPSGLLIFHVFDIGTGPPRWRSIDDRMELTRG